MDMAIFIDYTTCISCTIVMHRIISPNYLLFAISFIYKIINII